MDKQINIKKWVAQNGKNYTAIHCELSGESHVLIWQIMFLTLFTNRITGKKIRFEMGLID